MEISTKILNSLEGEAIKAFPNESCGFLVGDGGGSFLDAIPAPNLSRKPDHFFIDPKFHLKTQRELRQKGLKIIGVYHSHPSGDSAPSNQDKNGPHTPGFYWLITAFDGKNSPNSSLFRENYSETPMLSRNFDKVPLQNEKFVA